MIFAIVLAAGRSRRMGAGVQKLLLPFGHRGQTMIGHIVHQVVSSRVSRTIVVTGADHERVGAALAQYDVTPVRNPDEEGEMLSSVRCGLRALPPECSAAVIMLGDQPVISARWIDEMVHAHRRLGHSIVVPTFRGRRGHPLLFGSRHFQEVLTQFDEQGLRGLLAAHSGEVFELELGVKGILEDLDTPDDFRRAHGTELS